MMKKKICHNIKYFSLSGTDHFAEQMQQLLLYESIIGDIKLETGIEGLKLDFCSGVRVSVDSRDWHVRIVDADSCRVAFDDDATDCTLISAEKYYIRWRVDVWLDGEGVFSHTLDLTDQTVCVFMQDTVIGDAVGVFPYMLAMQKEHGCRVQMLRPNPALREILHTYFADIEQVEDLSEDTYAAYCLGIAQPTPYLAPVDYRMSTHDLSACALLGLHYTVPKVVYTPTQERMIKEKYVCIAVQASGYVKLWHHERGWDKVVAYLKKLGYRVLCIDGAATVNYQGRVMSKPAGAEDYTGMRPLMERVNILAYADFFIGLGSGLAWVANACDVPVVLISGFTMPINEFYTPYRVFSRSTCHGCYGDTRVDWQKDCPYYQGTERQYECSKNISFAMVQQAIDRVRADRQLG